MCGVMDIHLEEKITAIKKLFELIIFDTSFSSLWHHRCVTPLYHIPVLGEA